MRVTKYFRSFASRFWPGTRIHWIDAGGRPSVLVTREGAPVAWVTVTATEQGIDRLFWVLNPEKLVHIAAAVEARGEERPLPPT